ncbi:MAG TPA: hypothetical protein VN380_11790 [Thermoanaerobaculia bacterium]|jgi:hypothetical protein|nr:hypothetical protein [Thermoanaerobaculia bacterium]
MKHYTSLAELCVPALLNLWESDWERGIWPLLQAIVRSGINANFEEVSAYIAEWTEAHDPTPLFRSVASDPDTLARCAGTDILRLLSDSRLPMAERMPAIRSMLTSRRSGAAVVEEILDGLATEARRGSWVPSERDFIELVELLIPRFSSITRDSRGSRNWTSLWTLGVIGERVQGVEEAIRSHPVLTNIQKIIRAAILDGWYYAQRPPAGALWWGRTVRLDVALLLGDRSEYTQRYDPDVDEVDDW